MSDTPFRGDPFLEARHVDALTDAVRALNMTLVRAEERAAREHRDMLIAIQTIARHTQNLPSLVELLKAKTNGHSHHEENNDERRTGSDS